MSLGPPAGANSAPAGGSPSMEPSPPPTAPLPQMAAPPPRSGAVPPLPARFGKDGSSVANSAQSTPRTLEQLGPHRPSWSSHQLGVQAAAAGMTLPPLESRAIGPPHGPGTLPALDGRPPGGSLRIRGALQQSVAQLDEMRRALEQAAAARDRDALRALILECAPLERVLEALKRAKDVLSEGEAPSRAKDATMASPLTISPPLTACPLVDSAPCIDSGGMEASSEEFAAAADYLPSPPLGGDGGKDETVEPSGEEGVALPSALKAEAFAAEPPAGRGAAEAV